MGRIGIDAAFGIVSDASEFCGAAWDSSFVAHTLGSDWPFGTADAVRLVDVWLVVDDIGQSICHV
jgi:hypothetical protein